MIENSPTKPSHGRQEDTALAELLSICWLRRASCKKKLPKSCPIGLLLVALLND